MPVDVLEIVLRQGWRLEFLQNTLAKIPASAPTRALCFILAGGKIGPGALAPLLAATPATVHVAIRTHEPLPENEVLNLAQIADLCAQNNTSFQIDFVLDDDAHVPTFRLGHGGALAPLVETARELTKQDIAVRWLIPLTASLIYRLDGLVSLAQENGVEPIPVLPNELALAPTHDANPPDDDDQLFAWDFVTYRMLAEEVGGLTRDRIAYYEHLQSVLSGPYRKAGKTYVRTIGMTDDGTFTVSGNPAPFNSARGAWRLPAAGGPRGTPTLSRAWSDIQDLTDVLSCGIQAHLTASLPKPDHRKEGTLLADQRIPTALLIGAYGGEHIGDAAILGGVLRRIHAHHGTTHAILMTQRPRHTRHLVPMLDTDITLDVREYTTANIREALRETDGLVYAGGPITDIPKQLVRHLYAAAHAKRMDKPFVIEGAGPGVFVRSASRLTARRMVKLADQISVRTKIDAEHDLLRDLDVTVTNDPAFDYLETRTKCLHRIRPVEPSQIERLLSHTKDRFVVGLNIRPIKPLFTAGAPNNNVAAYTAKVEQNFEIEFAKGLTEFARKSQTKPCFIFFPMNAIQFGSSDLRSAHRIMAHLGSDIDVRVWEADASLDGVIALMRRLDTAVTMRFHATIFALAQALRVIGIDYRIGANYKVSAVMSDADQTQNCCRIDQLNSDWLENQLANAERDWRSKLSEGTPREAPHGN